MLITFSFIYSLSIASVVGTGIPVAGALGMLSGGLLLVVGLIADQISQLRLLQLSATTHFLTGQ